MGTLWSGFSAQGAFGSIEQGRDSIVNPRLRLPAPVTPRPGPGYVKKVPQRGKTEGNAFMQMPKIPKVREQAEITLIDGTQMKGHVFIDATSRIQDLLNGPTNFFPFVDENNVVLLINKVHVAHVRPFD